VEVALSRVPWQQERLEQLMGLLMLEVELVLEVEALLLLEVEALLELEVALPRVPWH